MNHILAAVSVLKTETDSDPVEQLFDVAKKFKPLKPEPEMRPPDDSVEFSSEEPWEVELDRCRVDPTHQRPMDREKVAAMKKDRTWEREPIIVNFDPDGEACYYILDGQHRAEAARQARQKTIKACVKIVPREKEHEHVTGIMAKTYDAAPLRAGDAYEGHILPSDEPTLLDVLTGLGASQEVTKVPTYAFRGRAYTVDLGKGRTITYVPQDAVEKDTSGILALPERGMIRFDGMDEAEVVRVLKTIDLDVAPVHLPPAPRPESQPVAEALGLTSDVEVLAEGIGGRTWPNGWVYVGDDAMIVHDGERALATYPFVSRHPTPEGDWRLIGPKTDLTVRPA